ncbi:MAG: hypothetical protein R3275_03735 [Saprospiraceae bacterium]|nr:hypothetical protein [Saprospiraceae bacterium]
MVIISSISLLVLLSVKVLAFSMGFPECQTGKGPTLFRHPGISVIDEYDDQEGYYAFVPKDSEYRADKVVGFVHGYGALNPMIFGAWIEHLVLQGHIVIYPRYQQNLIFPSAAAFTGNVAAALNGAIQKLELESKLDENADLYLFGHSFGGVIIANIAVELEEYEIKKPAGVFVAEAGTGPLTGAIKDSYGSFPQDVPLIITTGDKDYTVGDFFGKKLYNEVTGNKVIHIHQSSYFKGKNRISSSHYEPYSIGAWADNGIDNITTKRALHVAKKDVLDTNGYWYWLDRLMMIGQDEEGVMQELFNPDQPLLLMDDMGQALTGAIEVRYKIKHP